MHSMDLQHVRSSSIATNASSTQRSALTIFTRSAAGMNGLPAIVRARRMMRWQRQRASAAQRQATTPRQFKTKAERSRRRRSTCAIRRGRRAARVLVSTCRYVSWRCRRARRAPQPCIARPWFLGWASAARRTFLERGLMVVVDDDDEVRALVSARGNLGLLQVLEVAHVEGVEVARDLRESDEKCRAAQSAETQPSDGAPSPTTRVRAGTRSMPAHMQHIQCMLCVRHLHRPQCRARCATAPTVRPARASRARSAPHAPPYHHPLFALHVVACADLLACVRHDLGCRHAPRRSDACRGVLWPHCKGNL